MLQYFRAVILFIFTSLSSQATADDSNGLYGKFTKHNRSASEKYNYQLVNASQFARSGSRVERFELRDGDCGRKDCESNRERVERQEKGGTKPNQVSWHGWSVYIDPSYKAASQGSTILGQLKQEPAGNQLISLEAQKDGLYVIMSRLSDAEYQRDKDASVSRFQIDKKVMSINAAKGKWIDVVVHSNWAPDESGYVEVFLNGKRVAEYRGKVTYNNKDKVTFRYGIYRGRVAENRNLSGAMPTQVVYFDNIKRGRSMDDVR